MKKKKTSRFPDYEQVKMDDVITFGTNVWIRKDKRALIIVFPAGQELHFKPEEEMEGVDNDIDNCTHDMIG